MERRTLGLDNGIFDGIDFINDEPAVDMERSHVIWKYRVKRFMCPHCGNKTHRRDDLSRKVIGLHVPGYVDHGKCVHPECKPPSRVSIMWGDDDDDDDANDNSRSNVDTAKDSEICNSGEYDSTMVIVEEYWKDITKLLVRWRNSSLENQGTSTYEMEDVINQMNRALVQVSLQHSHKLTQHFTGQQQSAMDKLGVTFNAQVDAAVAGQLKQLQQHQSAIEVLRKKLLELNVTKKAVVAAEQVQLDNGSDSALPSTNELGKFTDHMENVIFSLSSSMASVQQDSHHLKKQIEVLEQTVVGQLQTKFLELVAVVERVTTREVDHLQTDFNQDDSITRAAIRNSGHFMDLVATSLRPICSSIASLQRDGRALKREMLTQHQSAIEWQQSVIEQLQQIERKMQATIEASKEAPKETPTATANTTTTQCPLLRFGALQNPTSIKCCSVFANNQHAISGSGDSTLRVWNLATQKTVLTLEGQFGDVWCSAVYGNDKYAVSGSSGKKIHVWDLVAGQTIRILEGHEHWVVCCKIFANDQHLLTGSWDATLRVWDLATGRTVHTLRGHTNAVTCCTVFADEQRALSGSRDHTLKVWNLITCRILFTLSGHAGPVTCCSLFDNDQYALSGSNDKTLRLWVLSTGQTLRILQGHNGGVNCCAIFSNEKCAISGSNDKTLRVWDLVSGLPLLTLDAHGDFVMCCAVFANDQCALSGGADKVLRVWDLTKELDAVALYSDVSDAASNNTLHSQTST